MPVYVDQTRRFPAVTPYQKNVFRVLGNQWCHLWADTPEELQVMADTIHLNKRWLQDRGWVHYDLTPSKRKMAIEAGAVQMRFKDWMKSLRER